MNIGVSRRLNWIFYKLCVREETICSVNQSVSSFKKIRRDDIEHGTWWFARAVFMEAAWARNCCWLNISSTSQSWSLMNWNISFDTTCTERKRIYIFFVYFYYNASCDWPFCSLYSVSKLFLCVLVTCFAFFCYLYQDWLLCIKKMN